MVPSALGAIGFMQINGYIYTPIPFTSNMNLSQYQRKT